MALRAGYYGVKRFLRDKLGTIAETYDETIKSLFPRSEQAVLGAKNLLKPIITSQTKNGVTLTVDEKNVITLNGTSTADSYISIISQTDLNNLLAKYGNLIINGSHPTEYNNARIITRYGGDKYVTDLGKGVLLDASITYTMGLALQIFNGKTFNNHKIYPMLRLASDPDDTYVPYAMTNRELTNSASDQKTAINAIITAATGAADFAAFKTAIGAITPVTRSLSLTKEDITEEVKEDVEPEKTVTKKRTTKKTEEV